MNRKTTPGNGEDLSNHLLYRCGIWTMQWKLLSYELNLSIKILNSKLNTGSHFYFHVFI